MPHVGPLSHWVEAFPSGRQSLQTKAPESRFSANRFPLSDSAYTTPPTSTGSRWRLPSPLKLHTGTLSLMRSPESVPLARKIPMPDENTGGVQEANAPTSLPFAASRIRSPLSRIHTFPPASTGVVPPPPSQLESWCHLSAPASVNPYAWLQA